jgi:hypothetical protein
LVWGLGAVHLAFGPDLRLEPGGRKKRWRESGAKGETRPAERKSFQKTKLTGKEEESRECLRKKITCAALGRLLDVDRLTVVNFVKSRGLTAKKADD